MGDRPVGHRRRRTDRPDPRGPPANAAPQLISTDITTTSTTATATTTTLAMVRPTSGPAGAASSATPTTRRKAPKPNRQRCKEFRERRKSHVVELEERVVALRREVSELVMQKSIYASKVMLKRHHAHGSLEKLVREYFTLFRYGIAIERPLATGAEASPPSRTSAVQKVKTQLEFLHRVIDPDTVYGDHKGPAGCVAQWGYYTASYASFVGEVNRVSISGTEDDPILYCFTTYHVILSRNTVKYLFPHAIHNEPLVQRMIGLYVPCPVVGIYQFTADGHISAETANIELADALLSAGCRVEDVAEIMQGFVVSDLGQVPDRLQAEDYHFLEEIGVDFDSDPREEDEEEKEKEEEDGDAAAAEADTEAQAKEKLRISFLVGEDDGDLEEKANPPAQGS
jgi:hypothetical protein